MQADFFGLFKKESEMIYWYKRDPDAWRAGVLQLTPEERGIYDTVIDVLYSYDGELPPILDDKWWARECNCNPRTWRAVRDRLIAKGKLFYKDDGTPMAKRVERTLDEAREFSEVQSKRARIGVERRLNEGRTQVELESNGGKNSSNINDRHPAYTSTSTSTSRVEREGRGNSRKKPSISLPENFLPIDLSDSNRGEFEKFKDHALTHDRRCADWGAAWRNWQRKAAELNQRGNGNGQGRSVLAAFDRLGEQLREAGATGDYIPGTSGPEPLRLDQEKRADGLKLISSR